MTENILVVKTKKLAPYIAGKNGLITGSDKEILHIITAEHEFIPRPEAEEDPGYKQIIPYVVMRRGNEVFLLRRLKKGGEKRLHGLLSLGVGGHINPVDGDDGDVLMRGLRREVDEEVAVGKALSLTPHGVINDDSNGVGSVHLGFFFTMEVEGDISVRETEKLAGEWMAMDELKTLKNEMETWSQIVLEAL
ncbi:MAG: NUDIX domain-containing protein [Clostridia bacterium]|nr:NUDIX domain-containing protein [Clostridia bacterium]